MLRINRETDYAIRVILALARYPRDEIIPSSVIRQEMQLPESLSLQIISRLANFNLINSYPGRKGGIQLAHSPADINLLQVIQIMEGPVVLSECLEEGHTCELSPGCPVQSCWLDLQGKIERDLEAINFQKLADYQPQARTEVVQ